MAGARIILTSRFCTALQEIFKVAVTAWGAIWIEPWVSQLIPNWHPSVRYLIAAIILAGVLELLLQFAIGLPRIEINWREKGQDVPISEICANIRKSTSESQVFSVFISTAPTGWIGHQILKYLSKHSPQLQICIPAASATPYCESSRSVNNKPTIVPFIEQNGLLVRLGKPPIRPGKWHYADIRWKDESHLPGDEFNIDYVLHHEKRLIKLLLNILVRCSSNANHFRVKGA